MPRRFVLHEHSGHGPVHYDLMIEDGDVLATWQFSADPTGDDPARCRRIADHRAAYLDYEGPVSRGRGRVRAVDRGPCRVEERSTRRWVLDFAGRSMVGRAELVRLTGDDWRFGRLTGA